VLFPDVFKSLSLETTYSLLDISAFMVIIGVALEEIPFFLNIIRFFVVWRVSGIKAAWQKAVRHWKRLLETPGFVILVLALLCESQLQHAAQLKEAAAMQSVYDVAQSASRTAAAQGVQVVQQQEQMTEALEQIARLEERESKLEAAAKPPPPPVATLAPPITPPPPVLPSSGRHIGPDEARIIRSAVLPGATVSIIPFMPGESESFANALAGALSAVPGAQIAVGRGNTIMNGQTGLIVQYDHSNPISASVFEALRRAGLNPIDGPDTPGPVVFIKVAPQ
jgi:hypothetical protein